MKPVAPVAALDTPALEALDREWTALRNEPHASPVVRALAKRIVAHRSRLFDANARAQAAATNDDDVAMTSLVEANQSAIKRCTIMLGEMTGLLARESV